MVPLLSALIGLPLGLPGGCAAEPRLNPPASSAGDGLPNRTAGPLGAGLPVDAPPKAKGLFAGGLPAGVVDPAGAAPNEKPVLAGAAGAPNVKVDPPGVVGCCCCWAPKPPKPGTGAGGAAAGVVEPKLNPKPPDGAVG